MNLIVLASLDASHQLVLELFGLIIGLLILVPVVYVAFCILSFVLSILSFLLQALVVVWGLLYEIWCSITGKRKND